MIKFKLTKDSGKVLLGFGLSKRNIELLKQGKPILIDLNEMGLDAEIGILYGETEQAILKTLKPYIGDETIVYTEGPETGKAN